MTLRSTAVLFLALAAVTTNISAQDPPPDSKFVFLGEIYREKNSPPACCNAADILLPENFKLDKTYHQRSINCCGGGAKSDLLPSDIPAGIHISVTGGLFWALPKKPVLLVEKVDDEDHVTQWRFRTPLYCGPGGNNEGCNIRVRVWAKRR